MRISIILLSTACLTSISTCSYAQVSNDCREALVKATYNRTEVDNSDWRLASSITENEYNTIKHDAGINAMIYGVPVGTNYSDYENRVREKTDTYKESLTQSQATNVMWTGLDPNSTNDYAACLKAKMFSQPGLHLGVKSATKTQVSVEVVWSPVGNQHNPKLEWAWKGAGSNALPKSVTPGSRIVVLPRPGQQEILAVNFKGYSDQLIVEPIPPPPDIIPTHQEETSEEYRSPVQVGWGSNWSQPYTLCTPDKPAGWTVVKAFDFHLESGEERNTCGSYTTCGGAETDTATRVCRTTSVQGHNENRFGGYGRIVSVFHVTWKHMVQN